jgi:hypothetical protein
MKDNDYIGKYVLAGITEVDRDGNVIRKSERHGRIVSIGPEGIVIVHPTTGVAFTLPPSVEHLQEARQGEYHLKSCDEVVNDPDYVTVWTIHPRGSDAESGPEGDGHSPRSARESKPTP